MLLLCKPVLDGDILSFNPSKLAQLLPERLHEDRATGSSAWIQETYAEDFSCCCASAETQSAKSMAQRVRTAIFFFMSFEVSNVEPLLNDFIRPRQHFLRNRQADLLGSLSD